MAITYEKVTDTTGSIVETKTEKMTYSLAQLKQISSSYQDRIDEIAALKAKVDKDILEFISLGIKETADGDSV